MTMFQRSDQQFPIQGYENEGNMVGKDVWKWKDGVKAIVWREGRHVLFQCMYEHFGIVPLEVVMSKDMKWE